MFKIIDTAKPLEAGIPNNKETEIRQETLMNPLAAVTQSGARFTEIFFMEECKYDACIIFPAQYPKSLI